jgi:hypothetical protein
MTIPNHDALLDDPIIRVEMDGEPPDEDDENNPVCVFCDGPGHDGRDCPEADESIDEDLHD